MRFQTTERNATDARLATQSKNWNTQCTHTKNATHACNRFYPCIRCFFRVRALHALRLSYSTLKSLTILSGIPSLVRSSHNAGRLRESNAQVHNYKSSSMQWHQNCFEILFEIYTASYRFRYHKLRRSKAWQKNRQTKIKSSHFFVYSRHATQDPHHTWHGDRGGTSHFCTPPNFCWSDL